MPDLSPCPFCAAIPEVQPCLRHGYFVECESPTCAIKPETRDYDTEELAAAAWNTRPQPAPAA